MGWPAESMRDKAACQGLLLLYYYINYCAGIIADYNAQVCYIVAK